MNKYIKSITVGLIAFLFGVIAVSAATLTQKYS